MLKEAVSTFGSGTVVSLTGSNPLDSSVMNVLQVRIVQWSKISDRIIEWPEISDPSTLVSADFNFCKVQARVYLINGTGQSYKRNIVLKKD